MDTQRIEKLLKTCGLRELYKIESILSDLIAKAKQNAVRVEEEKGRQLRSEERFNTNLTGTLIRISDVKPGERKEFSINIQDLSRSGMRFIADTNFIPSRVVEIYFGAPGGKIKRTFMEIVRMCKRANADGDWLEVGCRTISEKVVQRVRLQEGRIARMRNKLHKRSNIIVRVVGPEMAEVTQLISRIHGAGYQVIHTDSLTDALETANKSKTHLVICLQGNLVGHDPEQLRAAFSQPREWATLALVENEEQKFNLYQIGIDECLNVHHSKELLFYAMERALLGHMIRQNETSTGLVLIVGNNNTKNNLVIYQFEEGGYLCQIETSKYRALELNPAEYDMILIDYDGMSREHFRSLRNKFENLPVIALCDNITQGPQAMSDGANNYLGIPPTKENINLILEECVPNLQVV